MAGAKETRPTAIWKANTKVSRPEWVGGFFHCCLLG